MLGLSALIYGIFCFLNGSAKQKNKQLEQEVKNVYTAQKIREKNSKLSRDELIGRL